MGDQPDFRDIACSSLIDAALAVELEGAIAKKLSLTEATIQIYGTLFWDVRDRLDDRRTSARPCAFRGRLSIDTWRESDPRLMGTEADRSAVDNWPTGHR